MIVSKVKFLLICILFSTIMANEDNLANADVSSRSDYVRSIFGLVHGNNNDETNSCICETLKDKIKKLGIQHPELKHWFDELLDFIDFASNYFYICGELALNHEKKKCYLVFLHKWEQLIVKLPEERRKEILEKIKIDSLGNNGMKQYESAIHEIQNIYDEMFKDIK
ncbi:uncharacterized protein LOC116338144 [Contarinia nasturtii]|uniref:uncharacterized protein LOC116338144 n=1 Tax=Contarinia nasturtii TaxID=265458 RepID=UPI0012D4B66B|nr:uncharacterized protein LOC116338144 [Contarinia nasturtii]